MTDLDLDLLTKFWLDLLESADECEACNVAPLWLSKVSWHLLAAKKMFPIRLPKDSVYMPSCSLYQN